MSVMGTIFNVLSFFIIVFLGWLGKIASCVISSQKGPLFSLYNFSNVDGEYSIDISI